MACFGVLFSAALPRFSVFSDAARELPIRQALPGKILNRQEKTSLIAILVFPLVEPKSLFVEVAEQMKGLDGNVPSDFALEE